MGRPVDFTCFEFFAGGGMVRAGLGWRWATPFVNDIDPMKSGAYAENWGGDGLVTAGVETLAPEDLPGRADLAWASFPCQDLSLAGGGAGLKGGRSGVFWAFWSLMRGLKAEGRAPRIIALENVCGLLTSNGGRDFQALCAALAEDGWRFGAMVVDAARFVPQSRPRLFLIAIGADTELPAGLVGAEPSHDWTTSALRAAIERSPEHVRAQWVHWNPAPPAGSPPVLADLLEHAPNDAPLLPPDETQRILAMMSPAQRKNLAAAKAAGVGAATLFRRTRRNETGERVQRAEARFDGRAGCLRTPAGGSSRQLVLLLDGPRPRARLLSPRETARLMGLPDSYRLPARASAAYKLTGDGVAVPVVSWLAEALFEPLLDARAQAAA